MTLKGKAKELVDKYLMVVTSFEKEFITFEVPVPFTQAKKYALIAVDEIIKSWEEDGNSRLDSSIIFWWQKVKEEINKL